MDPRISSKICFGKMGLLITVDKTCDLRRLNIFIFTFVNGYHKNILLSITKGNPSNTNSPYRILRIKNGMLLNGSQNQL